MKIDLNLMSEFKQKSEIIKNKEAKRLVEELRAATPIDTGRARAGWKYEDGQISNDVEYIDRLNAGSSTQAPTHFIERTLLANENVSPNGVIVTPK